MSSLTSIAETERYGNLGAKSSNCGRRIKLTNTKNGKSVEVTVADACPTCGNHNDLDLSEAAFKQIATIDEGQVPSECHAFCQVLSKITDIFIQSSGPSSTKCYAAPHTPHLSICLGISLSISCGICFRMWPSATRIVWQ